MLKAPSGAFFLAWRVSAQKRPARQIDAPQQFLFAYRL
jgi:hypothetical protein